MGNCIVDIAPLANLSELKVLDLGTNRISDLSALADLVNLEQLDLGDNQISSISALVELGGLRVLCLSDNQISDISPLAELSRLVRVRVSANRISDLSPLIVNNQAGGLGPGDFVDMRCNYLDLTPGSQAMTDMQSLIEGGVGVEYERKDRYMDW